MISFMCRLMLTLALLLPNLHILAGVPEVLLAEVDRGQVDVSRYLVSEKLDGVRAYWDGERLLTRNGREIVAPRWFVAALPATTLDGELWAGRGTFERLSGIVRREQPLDADWQNIRYLIFELPGAPGTFRERAAAIQALVRAVNVPWLAEIEQFEVVDRKDLKQRLDAVLRAGGEGLMLHLADAPYLTGRSDVLLKVKPWLDAEATVIGHVPGKGKYAGQLGALRVRTPDGRVFKLGSGLSDALRRSPPPSGTQVTYRYRELTGGGMPRFPVFLRIRAE